MRTDAVELSYFAAAKLRDVVLRVALALVPGGIAAVWLEDRGPDDFGAAHVFACWAGATAPFVLVAGLWRWGRRGRVDADGVSYAGSARGPVRQLAWREIEELCCVGREGVELRGLEGRLRFSDDFDGLGGAWDRIGRLRGAALGAELRRRFDVGETLRFRGPDSTLVALVRAAILLAIASPVLFGLGFVVIESVLRGEHGDGLGCGGILLLGAAVLVAVPLFRFRVRCGWVELGPGGLTVQGLFRSSHRWADLPSMGTVPGEGLLFQTVRGVRFRVPAETANVMLLESLIRGRMER
jgi:hypothetical protein